MYHLPLKIFKGTLKMKEKIKGNVDLLLGLNFSGGDPRQLQLFLQGTHWRVILQKHNFVAFSYFFLVGPLFHCNFS